MKNRKLNRKKADKKDNFIAITKFCLHSMAFSIKNYKNLTHSFPNYTLNIAKYKLFLDD